MINSRKIEDLLPQVANRARSFVYKAIDDGIDLLITSTYRDFESQNELYSQGRTKPGKIVTNARAGYSYHNFRCAFDVVPIISGKPMWDTSTKENYNLWLRIGDIGKSCDLEWAGEWKIFKEFAHFQFTGGLTLQDLRAGKKIMGE